MPTPTLITIEGSNRTTAAQVAAPQLKVFTRQMWAGDVWTPQPYLWCKSLEFAASPTMPEAVLEWHYGLIQQDDATQKEQFDPLAIAGYYVKIEVDPLAEAACDTNAIPPWFGRVIDVRDDRAGTLVRGSQSYATGIQTFICWGMEADLECAILDRSRVEDGKGGMKEIRRAVAFNEGGGRIADHAEAVVANRSTTPGPDNVCIFAADLEYAAPWSARDILDYLLLYFGPRDGSGNPFCYWQIDDDWPCGFLDSYYPKLRVEGLTLKKVLDVLVDRRRGCGWTTFLDDTGDVPIAYVRIFSQSGETVTLESGDTMDGNPFPETLSLDGSRWVDRLHVRQSEVAQFDQVVVRGHPVGAVFTLSTYYGHLVSDWTSGDQSAYDAAASGAADYAALDREQKQIRNDGFRAQTLGAVGERMQRVFSWFALKNSWQDDAEDILNAGHPTALAPQAQARSFPVNQEIQWGAVDAFWQAGLRFEHYLPLYESQDYSADNVYRGLTTDDPTSEFLRPLVIFRTDGPGSSGIEPGVDPNRYQFAEKLAAAESSETTDEAGRGYSVAHRMRKNAAGLILKVSGHGAQHKIALNHFVPCDDTDDDPPDLDYSDNVIATLYVPGDSHAEVRMPFDSDLAADPNLVNRPVRRLYISHPTAHLDYVVGGTVVGLNDGKLQCCTKSACVRNDLNRLVAIASLAYLWYCTPRKIITLTYRRIRRVTAVGHYIDSLRHAAGDETIGSVVSRVRYDFDLQTTTVQTHFSELDLKVM